MTKQILFFITAVLICILIDLPASGLAFAIACIFVSLPKPPLCKWYSLIFGALLADIAAMLVGESPAVFWGLLLIAAALTALNSLPKAAVLFAAAWIMLKFETPADIYIGAFSGIIWNKILLFTYRKNCAIIIGNDIERNTQHG